MFVFVIVTSSPGLLFAAASRREIFISENLSFYLTNFFFSIPFLIYFYGWTVFDTTDVPTKGRSEESGKRVEETVDVDSPTAPPGPLSSMLLTGTGSMSDIPFLSWQNECVV